MIAAHVGGVPVEELAPALLAGGAVWLAAARAQVARVAQARRAARASR